MSKHNGNEKGAIKAAGDRRPAPPRFYFQFQLRKDRPLEVGIAEIIALLKKERAYLETLRDGIRLIWDLRHMHREDVLLELFPDIVERLEIKMRPDTDPEIIKRLDRMEQKLDQQAIPANSPLVASPGLKPIAGAKQIAMPTFDDDEDVVILRKDENAGVDVTANFLNAAFGLNDGQVH